MWMIEKMQKAMQQMRTDTNPPVAKPKPIASVNQQVGTGYMNQNTASHQLTR